ncbi:MAG: hypothetical protein GX594_15275 [Pirellulaceae bacterium]|nr:hypothetical protein [Pirellulaceae bacterium]
MIKSSVATRMFRLAAAAVVLAAAGHAQLGAAEPAEPRAANVRLPLVIPHPQSIEKIGNETFLLGEGGCSTVEIVLTQNGGFFDEAKKLIESSLAERGLTGKADRAATRIVVGCTAEGAGDAPALTTGEAATLGRSEQAYVIRMEQGEIPTIRLVGASPLGAYYAATTLVQLIETEPAGRAFVRNVAVRDYPDIPRRMSADWVLKWDWEVNCYDWGDGLEKFIERCKRKIDMCSRYKVNAVRFIGGRISPGTSFSHDRYEMIKKFAPELNRYARRKGVSLQYSASSCGIDHYGWGAAYPEPWILNRKSYPDGPVYECAKFPQAFYSKAGGTVASCMSNDALTQLIADRYKPMLRELEPGSIYLHHIDVAWYVKECVPFWKSRCAKCRELYPDDALHGRRGMAGAVARLYNKLAAELKTVKNPQTGYDAARDLQIVFAAPGYTLSPEDDGLYDKWLAYFEELGRQITDKKNVYCTLREEYRRWDDSALRTEQMAQRLTGVGWPNSIFMFAVQGGGFLNSIYMLNSSPVLTEVFRGSGELYNFNGHVHSEVQVLANVNYAWNHRAPGWVDSAEYPGRSFDNVAVEYMTGKRQSEELYGRFLDAACAKLYGEKAAPHMAAMFNLERTSGPLLPVLIVMERLRHSNYDWKSQARRNLQAKQLVDRALQECKPDAKEDLDWLSKCLDAGARFSELYGMIYQEENSAAVINTRANEILAWLDGNFQFQKSEPDGGDVGSWKELINSAIKDHAAKHAN